MGDSRPSFWHVTVQHRGTQERSLINGFSETRIWRSGVFQSVQSLVVQNPVHHSDQCMDQRVNLSKMTKFSSLGLDTLPLTSSALSSNTHPDIHPLSHAQNTLQITQKHFAWPGFHVTRSTLPVWHNYVSYFPKLTETKLLFLHEKHFFFMFFFLLTQKNLWHSKEEERRAMAILLEHTLPAPDWKNF